MSAGTQGACAPFPLAHTRTHAHTHTRTPAHSRVRRDHSKVAVTAPFSAPGNYGNVSCVGDMNRMTSQWVRGGGTVCALDQPALHAALVATFSTVDEC